MKHPIITPVYSFCWCPFLSVVFHLCYLYVCSIISPQRLQIRSVPPEDHRCRESHSTLAYTILCTFTPLFCFVLFCLALFPIQGLCQFNSRSPSPRQNMSHKREHFGHWEDLETWLRFTTDILLPKAADTLKHQTQDQLDDNITSLMGQDPSQSYSHKELAKIPGSLSHTLIATLKLSDKHAAQLQQELTRAQRRIRLELEAQERREGTDEGKQGDEEINRLKETLTATSQEMEQIKEDYADRSDKLQYAEQLLKKAKADFKDKNSRINALEAHLDESRNEISRLTRQLDYFKRGI